jgi:hypothetical protein
MRPGSDTRAHTKAHPGGGWLRNENLESSTHATRVQCIADTDRRPRPVCAC